LTAADLTAESAAAISSRDESSFRCHRRMA
jgi:hypothetical protein